MNGFDLSEEGAKSEASGFLVIGEAYTNVAKYSLQNFIVDLFVGQEKGHDRRTLKFAVFLESEFAVSILRIAPT